MSTPSNSTGPTKPSPQRPSVNGPPSSTKPSFLSRFPPWITNNLNNASYKLLARSWLASWAGFLLIIPTRSLDTLGNAAFFACMSSILIPPAYPVQIFFYGMALMILGSLLGWAWGCAAMKAALAVRDRVVLLSEIQQAEQTAAAAADPDAMFNLEVFQGAFLDARSSVIYGVFFAVGCFFFATARAYSPKLALFSVFGTIFLDIICSYGPLFPAANYTILQSFLISTAAYVAIGCVVILLVFPESLNHQILNGVSKLLAVVRQLVEMQEQVLRVPDPEELKASSKMALQIQAMVAGTYGGVQKLTAGAPMLSVEFSFGRFNGEDVNSLIEPLTILISRIAGLQNFSKLVGADLPKPKDQSSSAEPSTNPPSSRPSISNDPIRGVDSYLLRHVGVRSQRHHREELEQSVRPQDILPLLHSATADLRTACSDALRAAEALIVRVNTTRWKKSAGPDPDIDGRLDELRRAIEDFKQHRRLEVLEPFKHLASPEKDTSTLPRRALFYAFVFQANLLWSADAIMQLLEILAEMAGKRPKARLWAPKSLRSLWKILAMRNDGEAAALGEDVPPVDPVGAERAQMSQSRDPDSSPPTNMLQRVGAFFYKCYQWCTTPEALYAFKYTFVSVALWLPGVFRTSAYTNYVDKGIWALIMAQTTLEPFMADQIYSYFARLSATTLGIAIGLAGWYIGAGHGGGNPYGIAAVMGVLLVPLMFWRIFCPSIIPPIMGGITVLLVIGYSWIDSHLQLVGNPGVGWPVAWRRWLLVLIGSGASGIMMFMPPKSARKAVRLANASMIFELSRLYGLLISKWIMMEEGVTEGEKPSKQPRRMSQWSGQFRADFTQVGAKVQMLKVRTGLAQWEGSFRGAWPVEEYNQLNDVETEMLSYLAQLAGAVYHLDPVWRMHLLHRTKFLNPNFIAEVMSVFSLVSRSLRTGEPLQETLPKSLLERVFYHHQVSAHSSHPDDMPDSTEDDHLEQFRSLDYMAFAAGVTAVYKILSLLDRLHAITAKLCGETPLRGFAEWKEIHEMRRN